MKKAFLTALTGLAFGAMALTGLAQAQQPAATLDAMIAGAKQEGKLVVWSPLPGRPESHAAAIAAFNQRFGLNTRLEWVPMAAPTANTRAIAERAGGRVTGDIIGAGSIGEIITARDANLIKPFDWRGAFGATFPGIAEVDGLPEFRGLGLLYMVAHNGIGWNPRMIQAAEVPNNVEEMTNPKWQGKIGANAFFLVPLDIMSLCMGEERALKLADGLIANRPVLGRGSPPVNQFITTGQVPFGMTISLVAENASRNKEPIDFKMYSDYVISTENYIYVLENSPNPNTARLFSAWLAAEGWKVIDPIEPLPSLLDKENKFIKMAAEQVAKGGKVCRVENAQHAAQITRVREAVTLKLSGQR